jgi:N-acetyltransferase
LDVCRYIFVICRMAWIEHPVLPEGERVRLVPLDNAHFSALAAIAKDARIWEKMSIDGTDEARLVRHLKSAILKRGTGEQYPFTIIDRTKDKIIGSTMFHNIFPEHRKLEIGWTWYDPAYWRTGYNRECKLLLLTYCFERLMTVRVQLQTDENNTRSRIAIEGIGGKLEGVLRKERIRSNGSFRNTAMYSIIDDEWPAAKKLIQASLNRE